MKRGMYPWGMIPLFYLLFFSSALYAAESYVYYYPTQGDAYSAYTDRFLACPGSSKCRYQSFTVSYGGNTYNCNYQYHTEISTVNTHYYYCFITFQPSLYNSTTGEPLENPLCESGTLTSCTDPDSGVVRPAVPAECQQQGYYCNWDSSKPDQWAVYPVCGAAFVIQQSACYNTTTGQVDYPGGSIDVDVDAGNEYLSNLPSEPSNPGLNLTLKPVDDGSFPWNTDSYKTAHPELTDGQSRRESYCLENAGSGYCSEYSLAVDTPDYCSSHPWSTACYYQAPTNTQPPSNEVDAKADSTFGTGSKSGSGGGAGDISTPNPAVTNPVEGSEPAGSTETTTEMKDYTNWFSRMTAQLDNVKSYLKNLSDWLSADLGDTSAHDDLVQDRVFGNQDDYKGFIEALGGDDDIVGGAPSKIDEIIDSFTPSGQCAQLSVEQAGSNFNLLTDFCDKWDNGGGRSALGFFFYLLTAAAIFGVWSSSSKN